MAAGGWPSRIVGRSVGLRGGTARQSRPRGSVLGSAASRCVVGFPLLLHSPTVFSVARAFSTSARREADSRRFTFAAAQRFSRLVTFRRVSRSASVAFSRVRPSASPVAPRVVCPLVVRARPSCLLLPANVRHTAADCLVALLYLPRSFPFADLERAPRDARRNAS